VSSCSSSSTTASLGEPYSSTSSETCASSLPKGLCSTVSGFGLNMLFDDRAVDMLFLGDDILEILFLGEDILDIERFRARYSADFLVCERALCGIFGASSSDVGEPK